MAVSLLSRNMFIKLGIIKSCWWETLTLHETIGFSKSISEARENVNVFVSHLWLVFSAVCTYIQYFFDVMRNKLQTINIY